MLPSWLPVDPAQLANGLWVVVAGLLAAIGARAGFKGGQGAKPQQPTVEVAGAILDLKSFQNLTDQLGLNTLALTEKGMNLKRNSEAVDALRATLERAMKQADEALEHSEKLAAEMRELRVRTEALRDETRLLRDEMLRRGVRDGNH